MNDVATAAGVSLKTVSRVINGEPGVTQETLKKVENAIDELRYERNDLAASLRSGVRSNTIGLVIEDVTNPFYALVVQAVEDSAREHASLLIMTSAREDPERERELVTALLRRRVDALLIVPAGPDHRYIASTGFTGHTVFLDRPPVTTDVDTVLIDNAAGAHLATTHLIEHGHQRIAIIGDTEKLYTAGERLAGYAAALDDAGIALDRELVLDGPQHLRCGQRRGHGPAHPAAGASPNRDLRRQQPLHDRGHARALSAPRQAGAGRLR